MYPPNLNLAYKSHNFPIDHFFVNKLLCSEFQNSKQAYIPMS